jgi:hypothetical protein
MIRILVRKLPRSFAETKRPRRHGPMLPERNRSNPGKEVVRGPPHPVTGFGVAATEEETNVRPANASLIAGRRSDTIRRLTT